MTSKSNDSAELFRPKSKHAVHRLLELAENKAAAQEHWHSSFYQENHTLRKEKVKIQPNRNFKVKGNLEKRQRHADKEQLKLLADETINDQDLFCPMWQSSTPDEGKKQESKQQRLELTLKFIKNAKLRPFNNNMTFYNLSKQPKSKFMNSSLSFYNGKPQVRAVSVNQKKKQVIFSSKKMERYQQTGEFQKEKPTKSVVYFTSNKSETVRQLLNRMSVGRTRGGKICLNSAERESKNPQTYYEETECQENYLSQQQLKVINRYSKFFPFQKDEHLLYRKISEVDSIWLNKFKESWQRSKQNRDSRGRYLKKLIVK